jgi:PBP1b-binding outer membrane lipoprotein LpoB
MKALPSILLTAALFASGCQSFPHNANPAAITDITVNFQDPDKFTDVRDRSSGPASQYYLDELSKYLKENAAQRLTAGQKLTVTFIDIDLAGDIMPGRTDDVRTVKAIYIPRMHLRFQLTDASGAVISEGERRLSDLNFQQSITPINQSDPLRYDKQLLADWISREFGH